MKIPKNRLCLYTSPLAGNASMLDTIREADRLGLGGMELMNFCREIRSPDRATIRALAEEARGRGLAIPCFTVGIDMLPDPEAAAETLSRYAEICAEVGISLLHHTIATDLAAWGLSEAEREARVKRCLPAVLRVSERAGSLGVRTATENQGFVFNGADACLRLHSLSGGRIALVADVGNLLFVDETPQDFLRKAGNAVLHAHIKDYACVDPAAEGNAYRSRAGRRFCDAEIGTGCLPPDRILDLFAEIGYRGMFSLEFARVRSDEEALRVIERIAE